MTFINADAGIGSRRRVGELVFGRMALGALPLAVRAGRVQVTQALTRAVRPVTVSAISRAILPRLFRPPADPLSTVWRQWRRVSRR